MQENREENKQNYQSLQTQFLGTNDNQAEEEKKDDQNYIN